MFCTECGTALPEPARFCPDCGTEAFYPERADQKNSASADNRDLRTSDLEELPEQKGRIDKKAPPRVSPLTILFALIGLVLILILLNPWHAERDKPRDFEGSLNGAQQIEFILESGAIPDYSPAGFILQM